MKSVGIREAKARLSELARAVAKGEATILTDYGKPVAMVGPLEQTKPVLTQRNSVKPCCPSPIIWTWVSRATD
jgi:prevent-host-death family protein